MSIISETYLAPTERLEELKEVFDSLLEKFRQVGDIDIFVDFLNDLDIFEEDARYFCSDFEEEFDILCDINAMRHRINSLLH